MFGFGKKDKKKEEAAPAAEEPTMDRDEALAQIEEQKAKLDGLEGVEEAEVLNEIGRLYAAINEVDSAIEAYEKSLEVNHKMGTASNELVKLYNKKRAEAAAAKDNDAITYYMDKVNEMLKLSKDQLRGRA